MKTTTDTQPAEMTPNVALCVAPLVALLALANLALVLI